MKTPIQIWIVGQENFQASHVFNSNAFPRHVKGLVVPCMESLSIFSFSVNQVEPNLERDKGEFLRELKRNKALDGYIPDPNKPSVFMYKNTRFTVSLYLVLSSMKSFLDVYAQLVSKLIDPTAKIRGFNEAKVDGKSTKGGRLINWLTGSSPSTYTKSKELASVIKDNATAWMGEAINWRDSIGHGGEIPNLRTMMVPPQNDPRKVEINHIILPQMPNGRDVITYCEETRKNLYKFIRETFKLLPNIESSLVDLDAINK